MHEAKEKKTNNRQSIAQPTPSGSNIKDFFVAPRSVVPATLIGNSSATASATSVSIADGADAAAKVGYVNEFSKEESCND